MDVDGQQSRSSSGERREPAGEQQRGRHEGPWIGGVIDDALDRRGAHPLLLQERNSAGRWCFSLFLDFQQPTSRFPKTNMDCRDSSSQTKNQ